MLSCSAVNGEQRITSKKQLKDTGSDKYLVREKKFALMMRELVKYFQLLSEREIFVNMGFVREECGTKFFKNYLKN